MMTIKALAMAAALMPTGVAAGSVAEAIINTWNAAKEQIRSVTDNVMPFVYDF